MAATDSLFANIDAQEADAHWLTGKRFALLLGLLIFAAFPGVVSGFQSFIYRDFGLFGYPIAHYFRESFWRGELPLWNPYSNFGIPFLAQWGTMVLYPPSLIYLLFPLPWSLGLFCLAHLWFGGFGMYLLSFRWTGHRLAAAIAAIAFCFNGFTLNCLMWPNYTASLAWMPWILLLASRAWREGGRQIVLASVAGAMQMLSGTPEVIFFTWLIVLALWCCDHFETHASVCRGALRLTLTIVAIAALASPQLLPFFELLRHSDRHSGFASSSGWAVPSWGWANLLVPLFRTLVTGIGVHFQEQQELTSSYYAGVSVLLFVIAAMIFKGKPRVWMLFGLAVASFILAMGKHSLIYPWVRKTIPALGFMRYPAKFLIIDTFAWPLLAGVGVAALARRPHPSRWLVAATVAAAVLIVSIVAYARIFPGAHEEWSITLRNGAERILFLILIFGALVFALRNAHYQRLVLVLVPLLCWIDLVRHAPQQNPTVDPPTLTIPLPALEAMTPRPELGKSRALLSLKALKEFKAPGTANLALTYLVLRNGLYDNCNLPEKLPKGDGFFALHLRHEREIHFRLFESDERPRPQLARFLGISQVSGETNILAWEARTNFMPVVTSGQKPVFADRSTILTGIIETNFSPETIVFLPEEARPFVSATNGGGAKVLSSDVRPHRVLAEVEATGPSMVVVAQALYTPWRAFVDGNPVQLWRANHAFQAVQLPPGRHRLELRYRDKQFLLGLVISGLSTIGLAAGWFASPVSRKRTGRASVRDIPALNPLQQPEREACA
jgi:hypothetical protein